MGYVLGALIGTLFVLAIAIPRHILWCRREDRRFDLMLRLQDEERDQKWRLAGISEEDIAELRTKIKHDREKLLDRR